MIIMLLLVLTHVLLPFHTTDSRHYFIEFQLRAAILLKLLKLLIDPKFEIREFGLLTPNLCGGMGLRSSFPPLARFQLINGAEYGLLPASQVVFSMSFLPMVYSGHAAFKNAKCSFTIFL
jgi:hypothetical protein